MALPADLPRVEFIHFFTDVANEKICCDEALLTRIGEEGSEELHVIPARVEVRRPIRSKHACPACEEGVRIAPPVAKLLTKSNASSTLLAYVATGKYQNTLPLNRQAEIFFRLGVEIPRNTLACRMVETGARLAPAIGALASRTADGAGYSC